MLIRVKVKAISGVSTSRSAYGILLIFSGNFIGMSLSPDQLIFQVATRWQNVDSVEYFRTDYYLEA